MGYLAFDKRESMICCVVPPRAAPFAATTPLPIEPNALAPPAKAEKPPVANPVTVAPANPPQEKLPLNAEPNK